MRVLLLVALLSLVLSLSGGVVVRYDSQQQELFLYRQQAKIVHQLLVSKCPNVAVKREVEDDVMVPLHLKVAKKLYDHLIKQLFECQPTKFRSTSTSAPPPKTSTLPTTTALPTTTTPLPTKTTTLPTTTTTLPTTTTSLPTTTTQQPTTTVLLPIKTTSLPITTTLPRTTTPTPSECLTATNLTESWRLHHNGSGIKPGGFHSHIGYACDLHKDLQWFRFSGSAGNRMLNKCAPAYSCGTAFPFWTDEEAPTEVGVAATINVYESFPSSCKHQTNQVKVMRCSLSTEHHLIYKYIGTYSDGCSHAFCGMK